MQGRIRNKSINEIIKEFSKEISSIYKLQNVSQIDVAEEAEVTMIPSTQAELDLEGAQQIMRLIDALEDLDDVQNVYSNAEIPDEVMAQL